MLVRAAALGCVAATASAFSLSGPVAVRPTSNAITAARSARTVRREGLQLRMATTELTGIDKAKQLAGYKAVDDFVKSGMVVGLGTGSTAAFAVERVGQKIKSGELKDIICIPTSVATENQAKGLGIPLCTLNEKSKLDVAIDGADAVDPDLALVKGGGGALLREKMVEVMAEKFICIVDDTKLCKGLGPSFALPVEITPFCHEHTLRTVAALPEVAGCVATLRMGKVSTGAKKDGDDIAVTGETPGPLCALDSILHCCTTRRFKVCWS
jgi:ribose 5-phosphate isomerase A